MSDLLAFVGSARRDGNTDLLTSEAIWAARAEGLAVRRVRLADLDLRPCHGCMRCTDGRCHVHSDDMNRLMVDMRGASALLFATPVYFWNVSGLMKTLWDRMLPLAGLDLSRRPLVMRPLVQGLRAGAIVVQEEARGPHESICEQFFRRNFQDFGLVDRGSAYAYGALAAGEVLRDDQAMAASRALGRALAGSGKGS